MVWIQYTVETRNVYDEETYKRLTEIWLAHSAGQVRAAGDVVEVLRLHLLLISLPMVEVVEVGHDNGHGQGDGEHTGDGAQRTHDLAPHPDRPSLQIYVIKT